MHFVLPSVGRHFSRAARPRLCRESAVLLPARSYSSTPFQAVGTPVASVTMVPLVAPIIAHAPQSHNQAVRHASRPFGRKRAMHFPNSTRPATASGKLGLGSVCRSLSTSPRLLGTLCTCALRCTALVFANRSSVCMIIFAYVVSCDNVNAVPYRRSRTRPLHVSAFHTITFP